MIIDQFPTIAGSGGGCFRAGTQVQLEHGKTISIEELKVGDEVLSFDESGKLHVSKVTQTHYHPECQPILRVKFWRGQTYITPNHWVQNQYGSFVEIGKLSTHDALIDGMGHLRPITGAELIGHEPVYNLTVEPNHTFIADGVRVHNGGHRESYPVVAGAGGGGSSSGKGSGGGATEDPNTLQSVATISILDLLGEGQIGGLVNGGSSIFFNNTPIQNPDGSYNFVISANDGTSNLTPVAFGFQFRDGTQTQDPISGFSDVETPQAVSIKVTTEIPAVVTIDDSIADAVRLIVTTPALSTTDLNTGDIHGTQVEFSFDISINTDPYIGLSGPLVIAGKTNSKYQRAYLFGLPKTSASGAPATSWTIRMNRLTPDSVTTTLLNDIYFDSYVTIVDSKLSYPNSAIIGITINSSQFNSIPNRSYLVNGLYIQVPSNYDPVARTYTGIWDGTFKPAVSNNPAWILYDLLTNSRYGLGQFLPAAQVDKTGLYKIGQYCDGMVPDGFGGYEPRFVINTAIQTQADAYKLISDISSTFRGMTFWSGGMVGFSQDAPGDPVMSYNSANVIDGMFSYAGSARKDRHSVVLVTWNDPNNYYKQTIEYVEDADLIAKYGIRKMDTVAFGCTSRGQANRVGKWILYTESSESDMISFKVGMDSALVVPGEIIQIHDSSRAGKRMGGRLAACTATTATLDAPVVIDSAATLSVRLPDGTFQDLPLLEGPGTYTEVSWTNALSVLPLPNAIWIISEVNLVPLLARVVGIVQDTTPDTFAISAVEHNPSKYATIEDGALLQPMNTSIIDPNEVVTPTNGIVVEVPYMVAPGVLGLTLDVSWTGPAVHYEVMWKRTGEYATNTAIITTSNPNITFDNVRAGIYTFNVVGVNTFGVRSGVLTFSHATQAQTAAPGDVANFQITKRVSDLLLTWDAVTDIDLSGYEIRRGPSWDAGTVLTTRFSGTSFTDKLTVAGTYYYFIRSINSAGTYSDNTSTFTLVLETPVAVSNFNIIQSGSRLELTWSPNPETDLVYYEIREGGNWNTGTLVSQVNATTVNVTSGSIGQRTFWIKAVTSPGIYSDNAAWVNTSIAMPTNSNIVVSYDEGALNWPGNQLALSVDGANLIMNTGVPRSEYIFPVNLQASYYAQNSVYGTLDYVSYDASTLNWGTSSFDWVDVEAQRPWAPLYSTTSVTATYQIARQTGLNANEIDGWQLNSSLTSINGLAATTAINVAYAMGRYENGLYLQGGETVDWTNVSIPAQFRYSFWIIPRMVGNSSEVAILSLTGSTGNLYLGYNEPLQQFELTEQSGGNPILVSLPIAVGDVIGIAIIQNATTRKLFVSKLGGTPLGSELTVPPLGAFTALRLYWA